MCAILASEQVLVAQYMNADLRWDKTSQVGQARESWK